MSPGFAKISADSKSHLAQVSLRGLDGMKFVEFFYEGSIIKLYVILEFGCLSLKARYSLLIFKSWLKYSLLRFLRS